MLDGAQEWSQLAMPKWNAMCGLSRSQSLRASARPLHFRCRLWVYRDLHSKRFGDGILRTLTRDSEHSAAEFADVGIVGGDKRLRCHSVEEPANKALKRTVGRGRPPAA